MASFNNDMALLNNGMALLNNDMALLNNGMALLNNDMALLNNGMALLNNAISLLNNGMALLNNDMALLNNGMASMFLYTVISMHDSRTVDVHVPTKLVYATYNIHVILINTYLYITLKQCL